MSNGNKIIEKYKMVKLVFSKIGHFVLTKEYFRSWQWEFYYNDKFCFIFLPYKTWSKFIEKINFENLDIKKLRRKQLSIERKIISHCYHKQDADYIYEMILNNKEVDKNEK